MSEYTSIEQTEPGFVEDRPPERSQSISGIASRRRIIEYSPDNSFQENHSMLRTGLKLSFLYFFFSCFFFLIAYFFSSFFFCF